MGNWSDQQEIKKEGKEPSFARLVISIILPLFSNVENTILWLAALFGTVLTISSAMLANKILK